MVALGSGMNAEVRAVAVAGSNLYAGGFFTTAGGNRATNIAKWDGSSWSALGSGLDGEYVYALAVLGSNLYVGGRFTTAGGRAANYIANWDGTNWTELGTGMNEVVSALVVSGSDLYAGGYFLPHD
jgi:trimeric autotransporter adhesin